MTHHHVDSSGARYLDTLPVVEAAVGYGSLGTHGSLGYENAQVTVGGETFAHALSCHAPARLVFELGGKYARFRSGVALNDTVPLGGSHADFRVLADGQLRAAEPRIVPGQRRLIDVPIEGVDRLELEVGTTRWPYCHAVWLDPELVSTAATRSAVTPEPRPISYVPYLLARAPLGSRTDVLNALIARFELERYLEIGVADPSWNFELIAARVRESVDPNVPAATHPMTSDEFFARGLGCEKYDLVFIDGLHEADQVLRDIENSLRRLSAGGFIVCHDADPPNEWYQRPVEQFVPGETWMGTVWKAIVRFRERSPWIQVFTVDLDWGCCVIRNAPGNAAPPLPAPPAVLDWSSFEQHRKPWLNLVSVDEFRHFLLA